MSYSHIVDEANEVITAIDANSHTINSPQDHLRLQSLIGRNLLAYQELELIMKELAVAVHLHAPLKTFSDEAVKRRERIQKLTLGGTVDDVMRLYDPYEPSEIPPGATEAWMEVKITIGMEGFDRDKERQRMAKVIAERNWLVHGCLRELQYTSDHQVRVDAESRLASQFAGAQELVEEIRGQLRWVLEVRKEAGESFRSGGAQAMVFKIQASAMLADVAILKPKPDGSFLLQRLVELIRVRGRFSPDRFKQLRDIGFEKLLQEVEPSLRFEDRSEVERVVRVGILPRD